MPEPSEPRKPQPDSYRPDAPLGSSHSVLEAVGLSRSFGPIEVLSDVSIDVRAGQVHAVIGENGAGKSTLMKIVSGHLAPTRGVLKLDGAPVELRGPVDAERRGIRARAPGDHARARPDDRREHVLGRETRRGLRVDDREMNRRASEAMRVFGSRRQ